MSTSSPTPEVDVSFPEIALTVAPDRRERVLRWRRRSRLVLIARIALPALIGLILAGLAGAVAFNALIMRPSLPKETSAPIRLSRPRLVGRDDEGRAFVITADSATRDPKDYERIMLDHPALVLDEQGPDPLRIVARAGVYHEADFKLDLRGGVRLVSSKATFDTETSLLNTKTGEVFGAGPIHGSGSLGQIAAKAYAVYGKGERMVFTGGVRGRLNRK
jgi:lipopolysaccharide export system protein LptC